MTDCGGGNRRAKRNVRASSGTRWPPRDSERRIRVSAAAAVGVSGGRLPGATRSGRGCRAGRRGPRPARSGRRCTAPAPRRGRGRRPGRVKQGVYPARKPTPTISGSRASHVRSPVSADVPTRVKENKGKGTGISSITGRWVRRQNVADRVPFVLPFTPLRNRTYPFCSLRNRTYPFCSLARS